MHRYALSAIGRDRPGIVAGITRLLLEHGLNIEDSQATILRGHFSIVLIVAAPDGLDLNRFAGELDQEAERLGLSAIDVTPVENAGQSAEPTHMVSVYGGDHPGIVHAATQALADRRIDITDLNTRLLEDEEGDEEPLYALMMEVALPSGVSAEVLEGDLAAVGERQGVEVTLHELEDDVL